MMSEMPAGNNDKSIPASHQVAWPPMGYDDSNGGKSRKGDKQCRGA